MDSELIVKQVKGINQVRNVRLVHMIPIVHDLVKHFSELELNWIPRDQNKKADSISKEAASENVGFSRQQPDFFKLRFN